MNKYRIESEAGVVMGIYEGETEAEAIRAMNADAGEADLDRNDGLIVKAVDIYTKEQMNSISIGIAAEMTDTDTAELIGSNGKTGDARVMVFEIRGMRVASTNGDPVWEEQDGEAFADLMAETGIEL